MHGSVSGATVTHDGSIEQGIFCDDGREREKGRTEENFGNRRSNQQSIFGFGSLRGNGERLNHGMRSTIRTYIHTCTIVSL